MLCTVSAETADRGLSVYGRVAWSVSVETLSAKLVIVSVSLSMRRGAIVAKAEVASESTLPSAFVGLVGAPEALEADPDKSTEFWY